MVNDPRQRRQNRPVVQRQPNRFPFLRADSNNATGKAFMLSIACADSLVAYIRSAAVATGGPLFVVRNRYPLPGFGN
jgi:hypothetical protein